MKNCTKLYHNILAIYTVEMKIRMEVEFEEGRAIISEYEI